MKKTKADRVRECLEEAAILSRQLMDSLDPASPGAMKWRDVSAFAGIAHQHANKEV